MDGAPDLVIEVVSPGTHRLDTVVKFAAYEDAGVPEYWIVNPNTGIVEVNVLEGGAYALLGEFGPGEAIQSRVLEDFTLSVDALFGQ